jgi:hypothetical protein
MTKRPDVLLAAIRDNIFERSHWAVGDWSRFRWHTHAGAITADRPHSSQAFCISTWGTAASERRAAVRHAIAAQLADPSLERALGAWRGADGFELEHVVDRDVLGEGGRGMPTNLDALWRLPGLLVAVESKLSERFGGCRQASARHCTGRFGQGSDRKTGSDARCRLELVEQRRERRRYWEVLEQLGAAARLPQRDAMCPLAGGGYHVARVIAASAELGRRSNCDWRVVFAYRAAHDGRTRAAVTGIVELLNPECRGRVLTLDYDALAAMLRSSADGTARALGDHLAARLDGVGPAAK